MEPEGIILGDISQTKTNTIQSHLYEESNKNNKQSHIYREKDWWLPEVWEWENR